MPQDNKTYPSMSQRYTREMLHSLNSVQLCTLILHFGMDQVCARLGIQGFQERRKANGTD